MGTEWIVVLALHITSTKEAPPWLTENQPNPGEENDNDPYNDQRRSPVFRAA